jgi:A/G-specific adenine glycosylase
LFPVEELLYKPSYTSHFLVLEHFLLNSPVKPDPVALLSWYDRHRRHLPWRVLPGETPDAYRVWLSEIMCQQTTVVTAGPYFERFVARFPTVCDLAAAPVDDILKLWAGLGYYARARNLHVCAQVIMEQYKGKFPDTEAGLLELPGIGPYTAAAIASIVFNRHASPVDGNLERVMSRLFAVEQSLPAAKPELRRLALSITPHDRPGDFGQALMDLGATICTPRKAVCSLCPWNDVCVARKRGDMESFPRKAPRAVKTPRYGVAFVITRADGAILLRRRPEKGLLGGMAEIPSTPWSAEPALSAAVTHAPLSANWEALDGVVTHVFSHFPLHMHVWTASVPCGTPACEQCWWSLPDDIDGEALPTLMRKILKKRASHAPASAISARICVR